MGISPNIKQQHQHQMIVDDDDDDDDNELDPNIELPKLRIRQKELMKDKIRFEVQRLKQRTDNRLGRDMTVDNIASELAQVEKQIKVLTDASKSGNGQKRHKIKQKIMQKTESFPFALSESTKKRESSLPNVAKSDDTSRRNSIEPQQDHNPSSYHHSRNNSNESGVELSINHNPTNSNLSLIPTASNSGSHSASFLSVADDEFDIYTQCLPNKLDLSDIRLPNTKNVSCSVLTNATERIKREKKQLEEEYNQYFADQTEMLLLKLSKHPKNTSQCTQETQSTLNKLTQKLNDDQVVPQQQATIECMDEYYLYKEEVDKNYILRVHEFEAKQKKELDAFRTDLHALKRLKLEIKKKNVSASRSNTSSPNRSPAKQKDVLT